jgi:hypothetical protein
VYSTPVVRSRPGLLEHRRGVDGVHERQPRDICAAGFFVFVHSVWRTCAGGGRWSLASGEGYARHRRTCRASSTAYQMPGEKVSYGRVHSKRDNYVRESGVWLEAQVRVVSIVMLVLVRVRRKHAVRRMTIAVEITQGCTRTVGEEKGMWAGALALSSQPTILSLSPHNLTTR